MSIQIGDVFHVSVPSLPCRVVRVVCASTKYDSIWTTEPWSESLDRWAHSRQRYHADFLGASANNVHCRLAHGYFASIDKAAQA